MFEVCLALLPGIAVYAWLISPAILLQILLASLFALGLEALFLRWRSKPVQLHLRDGSALLTAWLLALSLPPLAPWWLTLTAVLFAIGIAKHLYGGLGQNPFNPAMVGFAVCIIAFPVQMSQWPPIDAPLAWGEQWRLVLGLITRMDIDSLASATPLDHLKGSLKLEGANTAMIIADQKHFGTLGARHWQWVALGFLLGGLWLLWRRIISWRIPVVFIVTLVVLSGALWLADDSRFAPPWLHVFSGATILGAFFIATDPVSAPTTARGMLVFGLGCALLHYVIRVFGIYPDGLAFAVLIMNISAPLIDRYTQPPIFGMKKIH